jgi:hypothetical protein
VFAFGLRGYGDKAGSFIDIGFYDSKQMTDPGDLVFFDVSEGNGYWAS